MNRGRYRSLAATVVVTVSLLGGCDFVPPNRPEWMPRDVTLEHDVKAGWIWLQCVDAPTGSVEFSWNSKSKNREPFVEVRPITCTAGRDLNEKATFEVAKSFNEIAFWFPGPHKWPTELGPCPLQVRPETLEQFITTLGTVKASGEVSQESAEALDGIRTYLEKLAPERLWFHGDSSTHIMCADISHVIPETSSTFPEHLKTGR